MQARGHEEIVAHELMVRLSSEIAMERARDGARAPASVRILRIAVAAVATCSASACTLLYPVDDFASGQIVEAGSGDDHEGSNGPGDLPDAFAEQDVPDRPDAGDAQVSRAVCPSDAGGAYVGNPGVLEPTTDDLAFGDVQAFSYRASADGCLTSISLFVPATNIAPRLAIGLYDSLDAGTAPSKLLGSAVLQAPPSGWNRVALDPAVSVTSGATYWIGLLVPVSDAGAKFTSILDRSGLDTATPSVAYVGGHLLSLPSAWPANSQVFADGPLSAYAE
jgi:hypothetical protein